jgi:hypothetical protein
MSLRCAYTQSNANVDRGEITRQATVFITAWMRWINRLIRQMDERVPVLSSELQLLVRTK